MKTSLKTGLMIRHPRKARARRALQLLVAASALPLLGAGVFAKGPAQQFGGVPYETIPTPGISVNNSDAAVARRISLSTGKSIVVDLPSEAGEVFVADPKVANAVVRTARKIFIIATGPGNTSVFVMDKAGAQIASLEIGVAKELGRELAMLKDVIRRAMPKAEIRVESVGDNFVLSGTVDSPLEAQNAIDIANNLVGQSAGFMGMGGSQGKVVNALQVRGKDQVMLKVTIAEVQRSAIKQLGINLSGRWTTAGALGVLKENTPIFSVNRENPPTVGGLNLGGKSAALHALERQGVLRTLAEPTLTAISGESAKFLAGGELAVPQNQTCDNSTGRNICTLGLTYKPVGVSLNFTPIVMSENRISIRVATEVTEVEPDNSLSLFTVIVPGFRTRKSETTVELPSGGVMATAGLIQQQTRQHINGLPGAMNLPILGSLFRSRDYQKLETELVVLVQPFIAKPSAPGQIAKPDDNFATATDPSTVFMGRLNRTYGGSAKGASGPVGFIND